MHVPHNADDRCPIVARAICHPNALAEWILTGPEMVGHGLADDDNRRRLARIARIERSSARERYSHRLEVVAHDDAPHHPRPHRVRRLWTAHDVHKAGPVEAGEWQVMCAADTEHTGYLTNAREKLAIVCRPLLRIAYPAPFGLQAQCQGVIRSKPHVDGIKARDRTKHEARRH